MSYTVTELFSCKIKQTLIAAAAGRMHHSAFQRLVKNTSISREAHRKYSAKAKDIFRFYNFTSILFGSTFLYNIRIAV